jgi:hypothetical protein
VVLVHGICSTPSAWSRVIPYLDDFGVTNVAVQLPSCLPDSEVDDADHVRSLLDECRARRARRSFLRRHGAHGGWRPCAGAAPRVRGRTNPRVGEEIEIPGDHFPNWLRPNEIAQILAGIAQDVVE